MSRSPHRRLYFFEIFLAAQFVLIYIIIAIHGPAIGRLVTNNVLLSLLALLLETVIGVTIRTIVESIRGKGRAYIRSLKRASWLSDTARFIIGNAMLLGVYGAIKLVIPLFNGTIYDRQLWEIDRVISGGLSPVVFTLSVFSNPRVLWFFDAAYAQIFFASLHIAFMFILSHPSRRVRAAFINGNSFMWCAGAWLYMIFPSLGPAYVFPDLWIPVRGSLPVTDNLHTMLMMNYQNVLKLKHGIAAPLSLMFGIAAFPSMHVAFQTFVFLWMRRLWIFAQVIFGVFTLLILLGSMITGWHYLIDGIAAIALAAACYAIPAKRWRIAEWVRLRRIIRP